MQDFRAELLKQDEPEAKEIALAIELFTHGSLNTFAKQTNVDTNNRLICYDILDLGKQLMPIGMLVVLDSILNRITQNRAKGKNTYIFIDEIYLLFQHEYSANFLFTLWKRVRKYGAYATGITQNVDDLLQSHTARTMLANSEFIIMLNQASTDRLKLAELLNISDLQMSYITNVEAGHGLLKVGSSLVPFANKFDKEYTDYGCPYMSESCDVNKPSDNLIVYGHHMKNGTMFSDLERFKKKEFWEEHKTFRFDTLYVKQTYEVIAVFKTAVYTGSENEFKYYQFVDAAVQEQFDGYIQRAKEKAFYDTGVSAEYGDKLITLSTCEYSGQNSRLVVVAKKVTESGGSNAPSNDGATEIQS